MRLFSAVFGIMALSLNLAACMQTKSVPVSINEMRDTIVVIGEGEAKGAPDIAKLQLGVEARGADAAAAVDGVNDRMRAVIDALKALGVNSEDLQTSTFNIHSEHVEPDQPMPLGASGAAAADDSGSMRANSDGKPARASSGAAPASAPATTLPRPPARPRRLVYRASNMLHVTLRDLAKVGEVLGSAVAAGANQAWGMTFALEDEAPLVERARAESIADARAQARALAKLGELRLGRIVSISDADMGGPGPVMQMAYARNESGGVPVEAGQITIQRRLRVVFAIETEER